MKIKRIYGIIPVPVFYVEDLGKFAGTSNGFFVRIVEKYKDDRGLLEHELQHCRQFYRTFMLPHVLLYKFVSKYRYFAEIECYRIQLKFAKDYESALNKFANFLATRYRLYLNPDKVEADLRK